MLSPSAAADNHASASSVSASMPQTAQSQVLHNQDLVHLILSSFCTFVPPSLTISSLEFFTRRSSLQLPVGPALLSAALTSKLFFNSAMRLLWYEATLTSLLSVIPVLVKEENGYALTNVIKDEHLRRLDLYAQYIKQLHISNESFPTEIYAMISRLRPTLLPTLKMINLSSVDDTYLRNAGSLLVTQSPALFALKIVPVDSASEVMVATFLRDVSSDTLQWLRLGGNLTDISFAILPKFLNLSGVLLELRSAVDTDILHPCSKILDLKNLTLVCRSEINFRGPSSAVRFGRLRHLCISAAISSTATLLTLFRTIQIPELLSLQLDFYVSPPSTHPQIVQCIQGCISIGQSSALQSLSIRGFAGAAWNYFAPIQSIRSLTKLIVNVTTLSVTDEEILLYLGQGGGAALRDLTISCARAANVEGVMTPLVLGIIAKHCPELESLSIALRLGDNQDSLSLLENEIGAISYPRMSVELLSLRLLRKSKGQPAFHDKEPYSVTAAAILSRYIDYWFPALDEVKISTVEVDSVPEDEDWCQGVKTMVFGLRQRGKNSFAPVSCLCNAMES